MEKDLQNILFILGAFALGAVVVSFLFRPEQQANSMVGLGISNNEQWKVVRDSQGFVKDIVISRNVHTS